jgi:hypothetical protein
MAGSKRIYLALRVYGDFHWPPVGRDYDNSTPEADERRRGVVEIYYTGEEGKQQPYEAVVRWVPTNEMSGSLPPAFEDDPSTLLCLPDVSDADLKLAFATGDVTLAYRLTQASSTRRQRHLLFRGAFLLQQYSFDQDSLVQPGNRTDPPPQFRLVLARSFWHDRKRYFSEVVLGQPGDGIKSGCRVRCNLAIPTPWPQSGADADNCFALPFAAIFAPTYSPEFTAQSAPPPPVEKVIAGPGPGRAIHDDEVEMALTPVAKQLGSFDLCSPRDGGARFLFLPRSNQALDNYWPTDRSSFRDRFLRRLSPGTKDAKPFDLCTRKLDKLSEHWHSVRFENGGAQVIFRTQITASGAGAITDDIRVERVDEASRFELRLPDRPDEWFAAGEKLTIEAEVNYAADAEAIWSAGYGPLARAGEIVVRFGFESAIDPKAGGLAELKKDEPGKVLSRCLDRAIKSMRLTRLGLVNEMSESPPSLLPDVKIDKHKPVRFMLSGRKPFALGLCAPEPSLLWAGEATQRPVWPRIDLQFSLWPLPHTLRDELKAVIPVTLTFSGFSAGSALPAKLRDDANVPSSSGELFQFRILHRGLSKALKGRLGGLELQAPVGQQQDTDTDTDYCHWRFNPSPIEPVALPAGSSNAFFLADLDFRLRLHLDAVIPLGAQRLWGDRSGRKSPLLIPMAGTGGNGPFLLDARETVSPTSDRRLLARLIDEGLDQARGSRAYVLLSEEPFSIVKFWSQPLQDRGSQDSAEVAIYDSDTRSWVLKLTSDTYHYEYPAQSVAESMDKPGRLEIYDSVPDGTVASLRPALDDLRHRAIEYRLTPSAELWVRPTDVELGYFQPEWATYDIFRQQGALGTGAAVAAFRAEFIYGLPVGIDTSLEFGAARSARVAEIEALTGRPPRRIEASAIRGDLPERWRALAKVLARRPERLEMWAREVGSAVPFAPARFAAGAKFALRNTALHRPPLKSMEELGSADRDSADGTSVRLSRHGLSGGALWGLESGNFVNALLGNPVAVGGFIERIALSPSGGDGDQRVEFLNGLLAIVSETRNGYVQRVRLEIIGRIAVFWHRAKHVIVYERTVSASAQFTPIGSASRTRRPVLRKVNEFIELLQPERSYPDFATAKRLCTGFLKSVRFNTKVINVDSAWSQEVGTFGFMVPLWDRHAAVLRPQVYPRPDIAFVTAAEGEGEQPKVSQECLDVDNIYFFSDATAASSDTDTWPARIAVDLANLPNPSDEWESRPQVAQSLERQPSASRVPRGHRRYTWRLAPCAQKTQINAERSDEPMFAGVESVTFMRSVVADEKSAAAKALEAAVMIVAPPHLSQWRDKAPTKLATLDAALEKFQTAEGDEELKEAARSLNTEVGKFQTDVTQGRFADHLKVLTDSKDKLAGLKDLVANAPSRCKQIVNDFSSSLQQKQQLILENIRSWQHQVDECLPEVGASLTKEKLIEHVATSVTHLLEPALDGLGRGVGGLEASVEKAKSIVLDVEFDVEAALNSARSEIDALKSHYDVTKPWSPQRLAEFDQTLRSIRDGIVCEAITAVDEAKSRLATELDQFAHKIGTELSRVLRSITDERSKILGALDAQAGAARQLFATVDGALGKVLGENGTDHFAELQAKLDEAIQKDPQGKYRELLERLKEAVGKLRDEIETIRAVLHDQAAQAESSLAGLERAINVCADKLMSIVSSAQAFAKDASAAIDTIVEGPVVELKAGLISAVDGVAAVVREPLAALVNLGAIVDRMIDAAAAGVRAALEQVSSYREEAMHIIGTQFKAADGFLSTLRQSLETEAVKKSFIVPAVTELLRPIDWQVETTITQEIFDNLRKYISGLGAELERTFDAMSSKALEAVQAAAIKACGDIGGTLQDAFAYFKDAADELKKETADVVAALQQALENVQKLKELQGKIRDQLRGIVNELSGAYSSVTAYTDRVLETIGKLDSGGLAAAPSNILKLYAAVASAPALPNLEYNCKRLKYYYNELNNIIDTTQAEAWFGRLGDQLKALGLSLPFDKIGDRLLLPDASSFDINRLFKNFSGLKLDKLFRGYKLPQSVKDAIKVTHAFDKQQFRAWVQVDVDLPLPGRRSLFRFGPVQVDFVDSRLLAQVRLEASKDTDKVEQTGRASLGTNIEAVIGGQSMVTLQKVALKYEKSSGLDVQLDPRNIKLNPVFRFIQETLGSLFPDEVGGMKLLKNELGIPVGVEHEFSMPPISLTFGTSGVSNIQISNRFALVAYPDFVISDRFSLSRPEMPFIFSIFIIGGTGYVTVDVEYRPFRDQLMVMVEAAAGGSAALGFAFGPVRGAVFITVSVALAYRKLIGSKGGGLTVSLVVLVAGNVDVAGIVTVYMTLLMRMQYRDNGRLDATGTLTITIRISKFFKLRVRANAQYKLRDGKSTTTTSVSASAEPDKTQLKDAYDKAKKLLDARA